MGELDGHECHLDYDEWRVLREASRIHERTKAPQYYLELSYQVSFATVLLGLGVSFVTSTLWLADESLSVKVAGGTIAFTIAVLAAFLNIGRLSARGTLVHLGMIALASFGIATLRTYESWPFTAVVAGLYGAIVVIFAYPASVIADRFAESRARRAWMSESVESEILAGLYEIAMGVRLMGIVDTVAHRRSVRRDLATQMDQVTWLIRTQLPRYVAGDDTVIRHELAVRAEAVQQWKRRVLISAGPATDGVRQEVVHALAHAMKGDWSALPRLDGESLQASRPRLAGRVTLAVAAIAPLVLLLTAQEFDVVGPGVREPLLALAIPLALTPLTWLQRGHGSAPGAWARD